MTNPFDAVFLGFPPVGLRFLSDLAREQNREWFMAHKAVYEAAVQAPMVALVGELAIALAQHGLPLQGRGGRSVFRIHRDVRFSKDKRPYKTHIGAALTRDGEKMSPGVLYVHIDPAGSFLAAGFYQPEPEVMHAIRQKIADRPEAFDDMLDSLAEGDLTLSSDENALKRLPRGFEAITDEAIAKAVRHRSWTVHRPLTDAAIASPDLVSTISDFAEAASPLLTFGWGAING